MYTETSVILKTMESKIMKIITSEASINIIKVIGQFIFVVFMTAFLHWGLVNSYSQMCIDLSWTGIFTNIINLGSPFCQFMNYLQFEISKYYVTIWASAGVAIIAYFIGNK